MKYWHLQNSWGTDWESEDTCACYDMTIHMRRMTSVVGTMIHRLAAVAKAVHQKCMSAVCVAFCTTQSYHISQIREAWVKFASMGISCSITNDQGMHKARLAQS